MRLPLYPRENRARATSSTLMYAGLLLGQFSVWLNAGWPVSDILASAGLLLVVVGIAVGIRGNGRPGRPPPTGLTSPTPPLRCSAPRTHQLLESAPLQAHTPHWPWIGSSSARLVSTNRMGAAMRTLSHAT